MAAGATRTIWKADEAEVAYAGGDAMTRLPPRDLSAGALQYVVVEDKDVQLAPHERGQGVLG